MTISRLATLSGDKDLEKEAENEQQKVSKIKAAVDKLRRNFINEEAFTNTLKSHKPRTKYWACEAWLIQKMAATQSMTNIEIWREYWIPLSTVRRFTRDLRRESLKELSEELPERCRHLYKDQILKYVDIFKTSQH